MLYGERATLTEWLAYAEPRTDEDLTAALDYFVREVVKQYREDFPPALPVCQYCGFTCDNPLP
jgi:rubrerythrin